MADIKETSKNVGDLVIARVEQLSKAGLKLPKDFDATTAIKMTMLKLEELKNKDGKSVTEVCSTASIQTALFKMCTLGVNVALNQAYALIRGNVLCIDPSYFGKVLMVKRIFPDWEPNPQVVRQGDVFEYGINPRTGRKYLIKHEQKIENIDNDFIGGYILLPTNDGEGSLYIMTAKQIKTAWSKSSSKEMATHKAFDEKMVGKTLINSGCNMIINSTPEYNAVDEDHEDNRIDPSKQIAPEYVDYEEVVEEEKVPSPEPKVKNKADMPKEAVTEQPSPKENAKTETEDEPF